MPPRRTGECLTFSQDGKEEAHPNLPAMTSLEGSNWPPGGGCRGHLLHSPGHRPPSCGHLRLPEGLLSIQTFPWPLQDEGHQAKKNHWSLAMSSMSQDYLALLLGGVATALPSGGIKLRVTWLPSDIQLPNGSLLHSALYESHCHGVGREGARGSQAVPRPGRWWQDPTSGSCAGDRKQRLR